MKYKIFFATGGLEIKEPAGNSSLGGSESALYFMACELAKRGHVIKVFCRCGDSPTVMEGVEYIPIETFAQYAAFNECDIFIAHRAFMLATGFVRSKTNWIWHHDILTDPAKYASALWQTEKIMVLSEYQKSLYVDPLPPLAPYMLTTRNGVDYQKAKRYMYASRDSKIKRKHSFVWASRPERGLYMLLTKIWPMILNDRPDATLDICYYQYPADMKYTQPKEILDMWEFCDKEVSAAKNVQYHGGLSKIDLYSLYARSEFLLYPTEFPEISWITGMEAMAMRCTPIATNDFAIPECIGSVGNWTTCETVRPGILIDGKPGSDEYCNDFITAINGAYKFPNVIERMRDEGQRRVKEHYRWDFIAGEWEEEFNRFFERRYYENHKAIIDNLFYHDDVVAVKESVSAVEGELYGQYGFDSLKLIERCRIREQEAIKDIDPDEYNDRFTHPGRGLYRFLAAIKVIKSYIDHCGVKSPNVIDIGCAGGDFISDMKGVISDAVAIGIDASPKNVQEAIKFNNNNGHTGVSFVMSRFDNEEFLLANEGVFDIAFCGEFMEHMPDTVKTLTDIERCVKHGGLCVLTVPSGPWEHIQIQAKRGGVALHLRHFEQSDIESLFGDKNGFECRYMPAGKTPRGEEVGNWLIWWVKDENILLFGEIDYVKKVKTTRPYQSVSACLITKNEEDNISRCLKSIEYYVDQIVIVDSESTDSTKEIASKFLWRDGDIFVTEKWRDDFSFARNKSVELAIGRHICWLDADEVLVDGHNMRKYLDDVIGQGCVIRQNHLMIDVQIPPDTPARIFKNDPKYRFKGRIHEQVEMGAEGVFDVPIGPTIALRDVNIAHFGYVSESTRRHKCSSRNLKLLLLDRVTNPTRKLGLALLIRDYSHLFEWAMAGRSQPSVKEVKYLTQAVDIYQEHFLDKDSDIYHEHTSVYYQKVLALMGRYNIPSNQTHEVPMQTAQCLAVGVGGLESENHGTEIWWVLGVGELSMTLDRQMKNLRKGLGGEGWKEPLDSNGRYSSFEKAEDGREGSKFHEAMGEVVHGAAS